MRLLDRLGARYRDGYWEGMASGAAVLMPLGDVTGKKEAPVATLVREAQQWFTTNGIVFAVITARMLLLSEATFKFQNESDGSLSNLPPRAEILEFPWPNGTTGELWSRMEQDVSLAGNAFIWKAEDDLLVRLPPEQVTIVSEIRVAGNGNKYKHVIGYDWTPPQPLPGMQPQEPQFFTVDEVAHWSPYPDPVANFRGMSWLTPVLRDVRADSGLTFYKTQYLDHGQPVVALKYAQKFREDTIESVQNRMQAKYGGVANAFRPLVLDQGADPVMGGGLKDLDVASLTAVSEERICAAGGVPPELLGLKEASLDKYQPAVRHLADLTCRPLWRSACAALSKLVTVPGGSRLWYDTSDIAALQAAETERAQVTQVDSAAILTFVQAGFIRESIIAAVTTGDLSLLKPDPNAPTPGVNERETITVADSQPVTGPESATQSGLSKLSGKQGVPPGGGQVLTKPQTAATKKPMPGSFPTPATAAPSQNGKG